MVTINKKMNIRDVEHPHFQQKFEDWVKWRYTYLGGRIFINQYMQKFSAREDDNDFIARKAVSYCPAFSKAAINDVRNSIFQRMVEITRAGGPKSYQDAIIGNNLGVDLLGSTMNSFLGRKILHELLVMSKVGIFIDMPPKVGVTKADDKNRRPYLYFYQAEQIRSWAFDDTSNPSEFTSLLLEDTIFDTHPDTGLPSGDERKQYKHFYIEDDVVYAQLYDHNGDAVSFYGDDQDNSPIALGIERIPFVVLELNDSLLADIADYQIALLNLGSSDMSYSMKSNFPFYTEQWDPRSGSLYIRQNEESDNSSFAPSEEVKTGVSSGRRYPIGSERPGFIHPSSEPLLASMKKQEQLKEEIRLLINLAISNLRPTISSAESKGLDERSLESGLSYIGLVLEHGERQIAKYWALYEGYKDEVTISYPEKYDLKSDDDRRLDAQQLGQLMPTVPSKTYQREIAKRIAYILLDGKVHTEIMDKIYKEIDNNPVTTSNPDVISKDLEAGLVSVETASKARGYPPGEAEKAKTDHSDRLKRIAEAQSYQNGKQDNPAARGIPDQDPEPLKGGKEEKKQSRDRTEQKDNVERTRGPGK